MNLKRLILLAAKYGGLFRLSRRLTARKVRILAYHGIWLGDGHFGNFLFMSPRTFAQRLRLLKDWGYPVIPLANATSGDWSELPDNATVITIDDGWYGSFKHMLPELERHALPATLYLTTYYCQKRAPVIDVALQYCFANIDSTQTASLHLPDYNYGPYPTRTPQERAEALAGTTRVLSLLETDALRQQFLVALGTAAGIDMQRMEEERWFHLMTIEEVADASQRGLDFQLHTHRHRIERNGQSCLDEELATNSSHIFQMTGLEPRHFCYPSGRYTPDIWPELTANGVLSATTTDVGMVDSDSEQYALPRLLDGQNITELEFEAEMSGFLELIRRVRSPGVDSKRRTEATPA